MTWAESVDEVKIIEKDDQKFEQVIKHVGPIWGQDEAEEKVNAFMAKNDLSDWTWTGCWWSENGTSYAQFLGRESNQEKIEAAEKYLNRSDFHKQLRNEF